MSPLLYFLGIGWVSFCFAQLEIAIEGGHGWAERLPTWRLSTNSWASRIFFAGKPATGYHIWMEAFILSTLHLVFVYMPFSLATELQILAFFCFFSVLEDFLWFVLNPAFGIKNFSEGKIWWHKKWLWVAPPDYFILAIAGTALYTTSLYLSGVL